MIIQDGDVFDPQHCTKSNNELPFWGDRHSMNMNGMVLTNISQSPYFTTQLQELKLHAQVCDEIYYNVRWVYLSVCVIVFVLCR